MIVASSTFKCETEKRRGEGLNSITHIFNSILFFYAPPFGFLLMEPIEGCRQNLFLSRIGQQVTSQLPCDEFVEWLIFVKRANHPVTPGPDIPLTIHLKTITVGIAGSIQPVDGHAFPKSRGCKQAIHQLLNGIRTGVIFKSSHFIRGWWQAIQVKRQPSNQLIARSGRLL